MSATARKSLALPCKLRVTKRRYDASAPFASGDACAPVSDS
jgi:hypothetical protein